MMDTRQAALHEGPKPFDGVGMRCTGHVDSRCVVNTLVLVPNRIKRVIGLVLVGEHDGGRHDVVSDHRSQRACVGIGDDLGDDATFALYDTLNDGLPTCTTSTFPTALALMPVLVLAPDVGFIDLNLTREGVTVFLHEFSDLVEHAPCGLVGNAKLAFKLLGGYSGSGLSHQIDGVEPRLQGRRGLVEDGSSRGGYLEAAEIAFVDFTSTDAMILGFPRASRAIHPLSVSLVPEPVEANVLIGELGVEILDGVPLHSWWPPSLCHQSSMEIT